MPVPLAGAAASCPGSTRRDSIQLGKTRSCAASQQRGDSRCFWVVQEQDGETSSESCWGCSCRRNQALGVVRSSRNLFSLCWEGRERRSPPRPGCGCRPAALPGQLSGGRTVQAAFAWEQGEPGRVTGLGSMFMKDEVCVCSTTRDAREELFPSPALSVLGGKYPGLGLLINQCQNSPCC